MSMRIIHLLALVAVLSLLVSASPSDVSFAVRKHRAVADVFARHRNTGRDTLLQRRGSKGRCAAGGPPSLSQPSSQPSQPSSGACFPSLHFQMPANTPDPSVLPNQWWCDPSTEYAFFGFSYSVSLCTFVCSRPSSPPILMITSLRSKPVPAYRGV